MKTNDTDVQLSLFDRDGCAGKMSPAHSAAREERTSGRSSRRLSELWMEPYQYLDLRTGYGSLLGPLWEMGTPLPGVSWTPATGPSPKDAAASFLSQILEAAPHIKYCLTRSACLGILRRAEKRGKRLPKKLEQALRMQAEIPQKVLDGLRKDKTANESPARAKPFHVYWYTANRPDQSHTRITAFACNQRDEVRDLLVISGALASQPGMKQQTFVAVPVIEGASPSPVSASFSAGAGSKAAGVGYEQECSPTLKGSSGGNMVPSVLCLNDQGGQFMNVSEDVCGTLRSQMHSHQPLVFENHGKDSRYKGPLTVAPTVTNRFGTGGNNVSLVIDEPATYAISGPAIDRQPQNGGNGLGVQEQVCPCLTGADRPAVFSQQRSDSYCHSEVSSTQAARQYKDATDLIVDVTGLDLRNGTENGNLCGTLQSKKNGGYSLQSTHPIRIGSLVRRLTPLECERLQGFPDYYTEIEGASDSARYKALGNSVAIPCVVYVLGGIAEYAEKPPPEPAYQCPMEQEMAENIVVPEG